MTDHRLPDPDVRFSQLILDYFSPQHLFIAEGEGARSIVDLLTVPPLAPGRKAIYYADTARHQSLGLADSLRRLDVKSVEVFSNRLELLRALPAILTQSSPPFRVYIAASAWFLQAAEALAGQAGIDAEQIMVERWDAASRKVCCALCDSRMISNATDLLVCSGCGTTLRITGYYRWQDHLHLGVPVDWPKSASIGGV